MSQRLRSVLLVLSIFGAACGGGSSSPSGPSNPPPPSPPPNDPGSPASLQIISGNGQTATVNNALSAPLVAVVLNAQGVAITSTTVSWVVTKGGGSVFSPATGTNQSGQTQNIWTLGTIAGNQTVEVRWVNSTTGAAVVIGNFVAKADPGIPITLSLDSPASQVLDIAQTAQALVRGVDEFGNAVSQGQMSVVWSSSDASITSIDQSGLMTGVANGAATIEAQANSLSVAVKTGVNDATVTMYASPDIERIAGNGGRIIGSDIAGGVFDFSGGVWGNSAVVGPVTGMRPLAVLPSGVALVANSGGDESSPWPAVYVSTGPGVWVVDLEIPPSQNRTDVALTEPVDGQLAFIANQHAGNASFPRAFHRDVSGVWTELPSFGSGELARSGHSFSSSELYVCNGHISYWDGAVWSVLDPGSGFPFCEDTDEDARIGYVRLQDGSGNTVAVVSVGGGAITPVAGLPTEYFAEIGFVLVGPSGRLVLVYFHSLANPDLIPTLQIQDGGGLWKPYWAPDGWGFADRPWVDDADGTIWAGARQSNGNSATFEISLN